MGFENEQNDAAQSNTPEGDDQQSFGTEEGIVTTEEKATVSRGTMVMFVIIIVCAGGLYYMYRKTGGPSSASASISKESAEANKTITSFLSGGDANIKSMLTLLKNTEKRVQQFLTYPNTKQVPLSELRTNPFRQFVEPAKVATSENSVALTEAAERKRREEERASVLRAVQGLQVQSIMFSPERSVCMINSKLFREGQSIDNFTVEKISPTSIVVKNGTYRFELRIQR